MEHQADISDEQLLAVVVDANIFLGATQPTSANVDNLLSTVIAFCNAHLMLSARNRLYLSVCSQHTRTRLLFAPTSACAASDQPCVGDYAAFAASHTAVCDGLRACVLDTVHALAAGTHLRTQQCEQSERSGLVGALASVLCHVNRARQPTTPADTPPADTSCPAHVLLITCTESARHALGRRSQHMSLMNVLFTAQRIGVPVHSCLQVLPPASSPSHTAHSSPQLVQAADITGGTVLHVTSGQTLLQCLLAVFLMDRSMRRRFHTPALPPVDYSTRCVCHDRAVTLGYVCSVCLAVYCRYTPLCSVCQVVFDARPPSLRVKARDGRRNSQPPI